MLRSYLSAIFHSRFVKEKKLHDFLNFRKLALILVENSESSCCLDIYSELKANYPDFPEILAE